MFEFRCGGEHPFIKICHLKQVYLLAHYPFPPCLILCHFRCSSHRSYWLDWVKHTPGWMNTHGERGEGKKKDLINSSPEPQDTWVFNCIGQSSLERMSNGRDQGSVTFKSLSPATLFHIAQSKCQPTLVICNILSRSRWLQCSSMLGEGQTVCLL